MRDLAKIVGVVPSTLTRSMALRSFTKELAAKLTPYLAPGTPSSRSNELHKLLHILAEASSLVGEAEALAGGLLDLPGARR